MDPAVTGTLTLVVEKGPRKGETVECRPGGRVRIGRVVRGNTFTIKDSGISQAHLSIMAAPGTGSGWVLTDLGSSNGTLLNGVRIDPSVPTVLRDGDAIKIGEETAFLVRIAGEEAAEPPPAVGRRRRNPRRGCAAVAEEEPREEAGGGARGRGRTRRTAAGGDYDDGDGERADPRVEESVKMLSKNTATGRGRGRGRGRGAVRKAATDSGCLPSVSEESVKGDLEAVEDGDCKILKEVKPEVQDSPQILSVKRPETGVSGERGAPTWATTTTEAPAEEQARVGDGRVAPSMTEEEEEGITGADPAVEKSCVDMESMTLEEWFDRMEKYLPKVINGIADEIISEIKSKAERFNGYVGNSLDLRQRHKGGGSTGLM